MRLYLIGAGAIAHTHAAAAGRLGMPAVTEGRCLRAIYAVADTGRPVRIEVAQAYGPPSIRGRNDRHSGLTAAKLGMPYLGNAYLPNRPAGP